MLHYRLIPLVVLLGSVLITPNQPLVQAATPLTRSVADANGQGYSIWRQGNDSNCDFIAVANGVQNIGGNGEAAYWRARALVGQNPRDFKESFYTLLGPDGSDQPFSLDNLGAAPEAFVGVYEDLGYNTIMLAAAPGTVDVAFAQRIYDLLAAAPSRSFAHLWTTPRPYNPHARQILVEETGEQVDLLYPYHEVAALVDPAWPGEFVVLDGLIGVPVRYSIDQLAYQLRGFNRVIVVSRNDGNLADHQRSQLAAVGQPYTASTLGGAYLHHARQLWGSTYALWGTVIGQPLRGADGQDAPVMLPGEFVFYERRGAQEVSLTPLGRWMAQDLERNGVVPAGTAAAGRGPEPINGIRSWVESTFGSVERFEQSFGVPISGEFWLSREQMQQQVLRGLPYPQVDTGGASGFTCVLTERALIAWDVERGTFLIPLGRIYDAQLRASLGLP